MAAYDYLNQSIVATALIQPKDCDSFYNPETQGHTGYAADGQYYDAGVLQTNHSPASWYTEPFSPFRGGTQKFPDAGLILLSKVALTILDETTKNLYLWMQFLLSDSYALANNFNGKLQGFEPKALSYADGIISVTYQPDPGSIEVDTTLIVTIDFTQDKMFLDIAK